MAAAVAMAAAAAAVKAAVMVTEATRCRLRSHRGARRRTAS